MSENKKLIIAIDGPAGAGKSTVAKLVADRLDYTYIDTGAMYRAVAWQALNTGKEITDDLILEILPDLIIDLDYKDGLTKVSVNGKDITAEIRSPRVSRLASRAAVLGPVREKLVALQRLMGERGGVVMDGRDIGTQVFPAAQVKIFLTASIEERAKRRWQELRAKGEDMGLAELKMEIAARDKNDSERAISPLKQAEDAVLLDSTGLTVAEVVEKIWQRCQEV